MAARRTDGARIRGRSDRGSLTPFAVITIFGLFIFGGGFAEAVLLLNQRARAGDIAEQAARRVADNVDEAALREGRLAIRADECFNQAEQIAAAHGEGTISDCTVSGLEVTVTVEITHEPLLLSLLGVSTVTAKAQATATPVYGVVGPGT